MICLPALTLLSAAQPSHFSEGMFSIVPAVVIIILMNILIYGGGIYLFILLVKALRKYLRSGTVRKENAAVFQSLGEALKSHRLARQMIQEFVAEQLASAVRPSANGKTVHLTPVPAICWPWQSSTILMLPNC